MNIVRNFRNELLKRNEVQFSFNSDINPGNKGALDNLSKEIKFDEALAVVKSVYGKFGSRSFSSEVFIYDSEQDKKNVEPERKEKKKQ